MILPSFPDNIKVTNLLPNTDGGTMAFNIIWNEMSGVSYYYIYRNRVPYGTFENITPLGITNTEYLDLTPEYIIDTDVFYCISASNLYGEGELSEPQTSVNSIEYQNRSAGFWTDSSNFTEDPHNNLYSTGRKDISYKGVNIMPSNVLRRYQFNTMLRKHMWLLQDVGEDVWLVKRKQTKLDDEDDYRRVGRSGRVQFYSPIKITMRMVSANETKNIKEQGLAYVRAPRSWTLYTPRLNDRDIIIDRENRRYEIQNVTIHSWRSSRTAQFFDLIQLPITDDVYKSVVVKVSALE